jgi:beta-1,4-mannosyl-glycoprotein beta-1,4-N-acetylglucosaminyltransferase
MRKVVDCFIFYNELDMLEFRLHELSDVVDYFVIAEGTTTFRGQPKPLWFAENKHRFAKFLPRIREVAVPLGDQDSWTREFTLRNALTKPLSDLGLSEDDLCVLSDVDEIPDATTLAMLRDTGLDDVASLSQAFYYYNLTCKAAYEWSCARVFPARTAHGTSLQAIRNVAPAKTISLGGWHFSNFMSFEKMAVKYTTGAHEGEFERFFQSSADIEHKVLARVDVFDRQEVQFIHQPLATNTYLPREVARLKEFFAGEMLAMKTLREIYEQRTTPDGYGDKGTAHSYIEVYEKMLEPMRTTARHVLEIGVGPQAMSLRMWKEYFPNATVDGVDPDPVTEVLPDNTRVLQANAYDARTARALGDYAYDLIIDDGSHTLEHQLIAVSLYRPMLRPGGLLIIEDVAALDQVESAFRATGECEIFDRRAVKGRYDDVLVVYKAIT